LEEAWKLSITAECIKPRVEPNPDGPGPEPVSLVEQPDIAETPDVAESIEIVVPPDVDAMQEDLPDVVEPVEPVPDTVEPPDVVEIPDLPAEDEAVWPDDTGIFEQTDLCQVVESPTLSLGQEVPYFLCRDLNPLSGTYQEGVSLSTFKELVWVIYFGSCG